MTNREKYVKLEQLPNVGPATAGDFRLLGIHYPKDLVDCDPFGRRFIGIIDEVRRLQEAVDQGDVRDEAPRE